MPEFRNRMEVRFTKEEWDEAQKKAKQAIVDVALVYLESAGVPTGHFADQPVEEVVIGTPADEPGVGYVLVSEPWPEVTDDVPA